MRIRGKDINFSQSVPTKVSDMKNGEIRVTSDGYYARVGNQILYNFADTIWPYLLDCGITGNYYEYHGTQEERDAYWKFEGTLDTHYTFENDEIIKLVESPTHWTYYPGGEGSYFNKAAFVLPLIHFEVSISAYPIGSGSDYAHLISVSDMIPGPIKKLMRAYIETDGEIYIVAYRDGTPSYLMWDGDSWENVYDGSGVYWPLDEWWSFDMERNTSGQWRVVIKNASGTPQLTTDWLDWKGSELEEGFSFGGNASMYVIGYDTSGPGGNAQGRYKNFSFCSGMQRFAYTTFIFTTTNHDVDKWCEVSETGAGGSVFVDYINSWLEHNLAGAGSVTATRKFGNTGSMDLDEFDVWGHIYISNGLGPDPGRYNQWLLTAHNSDGDHEVGIRVEFVGYTGYRLKYRAKDASNEDDWTIVKNISNHAWVRMRYLPSQGDTEIKLYYQEVDPESVYGWIPIKFATASPNMANLIQEEGAEFAMTAWTESGPDNDFYNHFLSDARRTTFETTTTTTTTTTT